MEQKRWPERIARWKYMKSIDGIMVEWLDNEAPREISVRIQFSSSHQIRHLEEN
jgi:hypothetical protein